MRILVVEDDRSIRETLGMVLETYQFQPQLVESGEGALRSLETAWPDAILLDLTLEDMNGEEFYSRMLTRFGHAPPTVVLSAVPRGEERVRHMPGARFLAKPYTLDQLINALRNASGESSAA
jgi:DNA-binding response OmpR family regulator